MKETKRSPLVIWDLGAMPLGVISCISQESCALISNISPAGDKVLLIPNACLSLCAMPTSPGPVFSGKGASWPLGHSPGGRQAGDRKDLAWLQARLPGTSQVRGPGQGGEEGSGAHWGRFIPETEPSICWVRKLGETDGDKECRQRRKRRIAGAGQESAGVGSSRLNSGKQSKL